MARYKIDWDELYPEGYLSSFSTRHMPHALHERILRLGGVRRQSSEFVLVQALEIGLDQLEAGADVGEDGKAFKPTRPEMPKKSKVEKIAMLKVRDRFLKLLDRHQKKKKDFKFQDARDYVNQAIIDLL